MKAWQPVPTLTCGIIMFSVFGKLNSYKGIIFLAIGIILLVVAGSLMEVIIQYDQLATCTPLQVCDVSFSLDKEMKGPIFIYYQIEYSSS